MKPAPVVLALLWLVPFPAGSEEPASDETACATCHRELEGSLSEPLQSWEGDVHRRAGLGCVGCHGGNPSKDVAQDPDASMSEASGFRSPPGRLRIPEFCGGCHSDAELMKRYDPQARVDQLAEYRTSTHGRLNEQGDSVPAVCTDCHGVHGIRGADFPGSPVHAANVPKTCARCHAERSVMDPYGARTDQYEEYSQSVHAAALLVRGDLAAPVCNDCHGNHGAAPPGVQSVANVCGQCHAREAVLFRGSFKKELFDAMEMPECTICHGNHRTLHPSPELFRGDSAPQVSKGKVTGADPFSADLGDLKPGETARATWTVTLDPHVEAGDEGPRHRVSISSDGAPALVLDATVLPGDDLAAEEVRRKASSDLSAELAVEPLPGLPVKPGDALRYRLDVRAAGAATLHSVIVRDQPGPGANAVAGSVCLTCHAPGDECDEATDRMYAALSAMEQELRRAEALLREAELAGMDVGAVKFELGSTGRTAVEARALIHAFEPDRMIAKSEEGRKIAATALEAGRAALAELQLRRKGLAVSLVLIGLVLLGLFLKIRQLDHG